MLAVISVKTGGHDTASTTNRVMKACVTYGFALDYSLHGQRAKKSFSSLPIYQVIVHKYSYIVYMYMTYSMIDRLTFLACDGKT